MELSIFAAVRLFRMHENHDFIVLWRNNDRISVLALVGFQTGIVDMI